jgi:hypothetical protein
MIDERPFRLKPRAPRREKSERKSWSSAYQRVAHVVRMSRQGTRAAPTRSARRPWQQRCAIRVTYSPNRIRGQWAAHGRYLARENASHQEAAGFDRRQVGVDLSGALRSWQAAGDPRMFKMIISPEFGERLELEALARELMRRIESDLGSPLEWVAVAHHNTEHPHVHVALRGVASDQELRFDRQYLKHGIRQQAEAICTQQLGFRTELDSAEAERREVDVIGVTSLDRQIAARGATVQASRDVERRLHRLAQMGLASQTDGSWTVRDDFLHTLRMMATLNDRQRMIAAHSELLSDPRLPIVYTPPSEIQRVEGRLIANTLDESGRMHTILESIEAKVHIIPHDRQLELAHANGQLIQNHYVRLRKLGDRLAVTSLGNAKTAHLLGRVVPREHDDWGGWLGRLQRSSTARKEVSPDRAR